MAKVKSYRAPFWWMIILAIIVIAYYYFTFLIFLRVKITAYNIKYFLIAGLYVIIILAEGFIYWRLRKRLKAKKLIWVHIILLYFALVVMPVLSLVLAFASGYFFHDIKYVEWVNKIAPIRLTLYWSSIAISQLVFVFVLVKGLSPRHIESAEDEASPDLLNEFT